MLKKLVPAVLGALLMASPVIAVTTASAAHQPVAKTAHHQAVPTPLSRPTSWFTRLAGRPRSKL